MPEAAIVLSSGSHFEFEKFDRNTREQTPIFRWEHRGTREQTHFGAFWEREHGNMLLFSPFFVRIVPVSPAQRVAGKGATTKSFRGR